MYQERDRVLLQGSEREVTPDAKLLRKAMDTETLTVTVVLHPQREWPVPRHRTGVARAAADWTAEQPLSSATYGASETDIAKIHAFAQEFGLYVVETNKGTSTIKLSGRVSQLEQAFLVDLFDYEHPDGDYRGRTGSIFLPASIVEIVSAVIGLGDHPA